MFGSKRSRFFQLVFIVLFVFPVHAAEKDTLAIFNFRPTNIEAMGYNGDILYALISAISMEGTVELMPRRVMEEMLFQAGLSQSDHTETAMKAGKILGTSYILFGNVTKQGADILSIMKLVHIPRKNVVKTWSLTFSGREAILDRVPVFAKELISTIKTNSAQPASDVAADMGADVEITNLEAKNQGKNVLLTWVFDPSHPIASFNVYRSESSQGPYQSIGNSSLNRFEDTRIKKGRTYYYGIGILLQSGTEKKSRLTTMIENAGEKVPHPPLVISSKGYIRRAEIKFVPSLQNEEEGFSIQYYDVFRKDAGAERFQSIQQIENKQKSRYDLSFLVEDVKGLEDGKTYEYALVSVDRKKRKSPLSDRLTVTTTSRPTLRLEKDDLLRKIRFSWDPLENVNGFYLYRKALSGSSWNQVGKIDSGSQSSYTDQNNLTDGGRYHYYLTAYDEKGETGSSQTIEAKTKDLPGFPDGLKAKSGLVKSVHVGWDPINDPDIGGYSIYRGTEPQKLERVAQVKGAHSLSYMDRGKTFEALEDGRTYYYSVVSYNLFDAEGPSSPAVSATTKPRPSRVTGIVVAADESNNILIRWANNPEPDIRRYALYRSKNDGYWSLLRDVGGEQNSFRDFELSPGVNYRYRIIAVDRDDLKSDPAESETILSPMIRQD